MSSNDIPAVVRPAPWKLLCWLAACIAIGAALAWVSLHVQTYFAPVFLFPILAGVAVGAACAAAMKLLEFYYRPALLTGAALAVVIFVVAQHYIGYRWAAARAMDHDVQQASQAIRQMMGGKPAATFGPLPPASLGEFLNNEAARGRTLWGHKLTHGWVWASWGVEAGLSLLAALLFMASASQRPDQPSNENTRGSAP